MQANIMEMIAILGCHLKGMIFIPLKLINPMRAVRANERRVIIPIYMITGFPNIMK